MNDLLQNPIIIGGVIPAIIIGIYNFSLKIISRHLTISEVIISIALAMLLVGILWGFYNSETISFKKPYFWGSFGIGIIYAFAVIGITYAFANLNANTSQIIPIITTNILLVSILSVVFLGENVNIIKVSLGSILIILGSILVI